MMTVEAARRLSDGDVCFVGIGLPSLASNLARRTHAPRCVLIYESGTIGGTGSLDSTVIGDYDHPSVRLPGAGGAPEIARHCREIFVMLRQSSRSLVEQLDFLSSSGDRVSTVVTDLGVLEPDSESRELTLTTLHRGASVKEAVAATGWGLRVAENVGETTPPSVAELAALRNLTA
jgi:glutaconate CoA-transferase subunit B